jgi:Flp pilus assembly protein TadD
MYLYHSKLADPAWLEKMLFGRRDTADWLEKIALLFAESGKVTHSLLIGNRGMGKSHLMSVLYHRLMHHEIVRKNVVIAYLEEDPYGIADYLDLLRRIIKAIAQKEQSPAAKQRLLDAHQTLISTEPKQRIVTAQHILLEHLARRRMLLLVENLNQIFEALGEEGQSRWRDFLQTHDNTMICATSQAIFSDVQHRESPFFAFFHLTYLQKLHYPEAHDLLLAMAEAQKNTELIAYVDTPEGEAKLRAIFELTEGNHRLLVAFFDFFMAEFRAELSKSFLRTIDQMKPYYESFLKQLPPQQQKIVQFLVQERIPQPGRTIANNCFLPINALSKQMSELQRLGYVQNTRQGRDAYYEITEPMLRMCLESNENTDGILSIFVDFLGSLYSAQDLKFHFLRFQLFADTTRDPIMRSKMAEEAYLYRKAVKRYAPNWEPDTQELSMVREASVQEQEQTIWRVVEDSEFGAHRDQFSNLIDQKQYREAESLLEKAFPNHLSHYYWRLLGYLLHDEGRISEAETAYRKSIEIKSTDWVVWYNLGLLLGNANRIEAAEAAFKKVIEIKPDYANAWSNLGVALYHANRMEAAEAAYKKAIEIKPDDFDAWYNLGGLLDNANRMEAAEAAYKKAIEINPSHPNAWHNLVFLLSDTNQIEKAEQTVGWFLEKFNAIPAIKTGMFFNFEVLLGRVGKNNAALEHLAASKIGAEAMDVLLAILTAITKHPKTVMIEVFKNEHFQQFLKKYEKDSLPKAIQAMTQHFMTSEDVPTAQLHDFHAALTEVFGRKTDMHYPLKFLHLGIRHVKENDSKALLELTLEERRVFEREVLGKTGKDEPAPESDFPK